MKKNCLLLVLLFFSCVQICSAPKTQKKLYLRCAKVLEQFILAERNNSLNSYDSMISIFSGLHVNYKNLRKMVRHDISKCRIFLRKNNQNSHVYKRLLHHLRALFFYVKDNRDSYNAIHFHDYLRKHYKLAFNNPNIAECVENDPDLYGVGHSRHQCRTYFNQITADLREIDKIEDYLHSDNYLLKAHNYVYKIELIKIRNYIYHNNRYKFETRYF